MSDGGIGQLAKRGGVDIDTVRYYERNGLLAPRARLRFIRRAQAPGFTLTEINELLELSAQRDVGSSTRRKQSCSV
jgi:DNA-binding transcriptional MerR regulator